MVVADEKDEAKSEELLIWERERKKELLDHRSQSVDLRQKSGDGFIRALLTLSASTLGFSLSFLGVLFRADIPVKMTMPLYFCWALLLAAVVIITWSHLRSETAYKLNIDRQDLLIDQIYKEDDNEIKQRLAALASQMDESNACVRLMKRSSLFCFSVAICLFVWFAAHNLTNAINPY